MNGRNSAFSIERMRPEDLDMVVAWAAEEGWNPGLHDAALFYPVDPEGFFLARKERNPVGAISAVRYDGDFGFIGFFLVRPEERGGRIGPELGRVAMEHLVGCNVGLDGVERKVRNYETAGFRFAYRNLRFLGSARKSSPFSGIVPASSVPFRDVADYDRRCFPAPRNDFLKAWLVAPGAFSAACVEAGRLRGFGSIRTCREGYKVGPLFADDLDVAVRLYGGLSAFADEGAPVFLDVPEPNTEAMRLASEGGMERVFATARMYSGEVPRIDLDRVFGVTTFELG